MSNLSAPAAQETQSKSGNTAKGLETCTYIPRYDALAIPDLGVVHGGIAYPNTSGVVMRTIPSVSILMRTIQAPGIVYQPTMITSTGAVCPGLGFIPQAFHAFPQQSGPNYLGATVSEANQRAMNSAEGGKVSENRDEKPDDNDPFRMYPVRELDNTWTQRNKMTIESGDIGDCIWYSNDSGYYAVRQPS